MIALDTNILIRYFSDEGDAASRRAIRLIERELTVDRPGFIAAVSLCEIVWVVRSRYGFRLAAQKALIEVLLAAAQIVIEHEAAVRSALDTTHPDLADAIIHHVGLANGCTHTLTLDRRFARLEGVQLLA